METWRALARLRFDLLVHQDKRGGGIKGTGKGEIFVVGGLGWQFACVFVVGCFVLLLNIIILTTRGIITEGSVCGGVVWERTKPEHQKSLRNPANLLDQATATILSYCAPGLITGAAMYGAGTASVRCRYADVRCR